MLCNISCKFSLILASHCLTVAWPWLYALRENPFYISRIRSMSIMDIYFSPHFYHFSMAQPRTASKRGKLPAPRWPVTRWMCARTPQRGVSGSVATRSETGQSTSASDVTTSGHGLTDAAASYPGADESPLSAEVTTSIVELIKQTVSDELRSALHSMQEAPLGTGNQRVESQEPLSVICLSRAFPLKPHQLTVPSLCSPHGLWTVVGMASFLVTIAPCRHRESMPFRIHFR